jgi:hypothetical protein
MSSIQAIKTGGGGVWLSQRFFAKACYGRIARCPSIAWELARPHDIRLADPIKTLHHMSVELPKCNRRALRRVRRASYSLDKTGIAKNGSQPGVVAGLSIRGAQPGNNFGRKTQLWATVSSAVVDILLTSWAAELQITCRVARANAIGHDIFMD